jgi:hypothetical protein
MLDRLERYDVTWDSPSLDASGSVPLGNGDVAVNLWVEKDGDLLILLAKGDAWDENCSLLKLGRVRVRFEPNPFVAGAPFRQTLKLRTAEAEVVAGDVTIRAWVDANHSAMRIEADANEPCDMRVSLEPWRTRPYTIKTQTSDLFKNLAGKNADPYPTVVSPDHLLRAKDRIVWCHHNEKREHDGFEITMKLQGLGGFIGQIPHPLLGRTFGGAIEGDGFESIDELTLKSSQPLLRHRLNIYALTAHPSTVVRWKQELASTIERIEAVDPEQARRDHDRWWDEFWDRSWIQVSSNTDPQNAFQVTRAYVLQRFMNACAGRGAFPIKHNGSLFSVGEPDDPDFRRWGGPGWWFMNQRLIYWPMLAAGDFDLMLPWLRMYRDMLPLQRHRTQTYFNHGGAYYPETITFWGAEVSAHYGWTTFEQRATPEAESPYIRYYWSGGIELVLIMLEYFQFTGDERFARDVLLPVADAVTEFYDLHYPRDENGKFRFEPAQALETWQDATNPLPEIAGLRYVLSNLLNALTPSPGTAKSSASTPSPGTAKGSASTPSPGTPGEGRGEGSAANTENVANSGHAPLPRPLPEYGERELCSLRQRWHRMLDELPPIPIGEKDGNRVVLPAQRFDQKKNTENPELYCTFPYRIYGVGKPDLQLARDTFAARLHQSHDCWSQDDIQMALLGLTDQAKEWISKRAAPASHSDSRFPAFWNAFHDWVPDVDHGGVLQMALQSMLMQCEGREIRILPAWPKVWDVNFKLHAPFQTVVEGRVRNGQVEELRLTSESRRADVILATPHP